MIGISVTGVSGVRFDIINSNNSHLKLAKLKFTISEASLKIFRLPSTEFFPA
ncbi:MAG TPA: hypothetical protein VF599_19215 [Pyrinomonadaceae bacterium]